MLSQLDRRGHDGEHGLELTTGVDRERNQWGEDGNQDEQTERDDGRRSGRSHSNAAVSTVAVHDEGSILQSETTTR